MASPALEPAATAVSPPSTASDLPCRPAKWNALAQCLPTCTTPVRSETTIADTSMTAPPR